MNIVYDRVEWEDLPQKTTPLNAENLNNMDAGIANVTDLANELDTRVGNAITAEELDEILEQ
jgi:hypothetical protein